MGPETLEWFKQDAIVRPMLAQAQHFMIDAEIVDVAEKIARQKNFSKEDFDFGFQWEMPFSHVVLERDGMPFLIYEEGDEVRCLWRADGCEGAFGIKTQRGKLMMVPSAFTDETGHEKLRRGAQGWSQDQWGSYQLIAMLSDAILALIAEPRLVQKTAPQRCHRRRAERQLGPIGVPAWHRVSWTIGSESLRNKDRSGSGAPLPLHFSRAHWRRTEEHKPKAQRRPGKPGWWCWVKWSFKGHPDFGVRLHHYMPRIGSEEAQRLATIMAADSAVAGWAQQAS